MIVASRFILLLLGCGPFMLPVPAAAQIGPQQATLQFSASSYSAGEGAGTIAVTITRSGRLDNTVSVRLATINGSATAGSDYTAVSTTVVFSGLFGTPTRTVHIPILDDAIGENRERLLVTLSAPTGGATIEVSPIAYVHIDNDDPPTSAPTLSVAASPNPRQLRLSWTPVPGATGITSYYRSHPRPPFGVLGSHSGGSTYANHDISVPGYQWASAQYKVRACNTYGCVESNAASVPTVAMLDAIGYFKQRTPGASDEFGKTLAVSADGTTLAVGAPIESSEYWPLGAVFIFKRQQNGGWWEEARLKSTEFISHEFGGSVALSADGSTLVLGATRDHSSTAGVNSNGHDSSMPFSGAAYVFTRTGSQWSRQAYLKASNPGSANFFGFSVAVSGDGNTVAVGANEEDSNATGVGGSQNNDSAPRSGAVYVFARSGDQWSQQAYVKASNTDAVDEFGWSVALSFDGATLAVGARCEASSATGVNGAQGNNDSSGAGAAYAFTRVGGQWSQQAYLKASNTEAVNIDPLDANPCGLFGETDEFGESASLSADGNTLAVGAPGESSNNGDQGNNQGADAGAVYVFTRSGGQWSQPTYIKAINVHHRDRFGNHVALSGDGGWLVVGAPDEDYFAFGVAEPPAGQPQVDLQSVGAVYLYRKSLNPLGWVHSKYLKAPNAESGDRFGTVAVSDDGSMIAVGAPGEDSLDGGVGASQSDNSARLPGRVGAAGAVYIY